MEPRTLTIQSSLSLSLFHMFRPSDRASEEGFGTHPDWWLHLFDMLLIIAHPYLHILLDAAAVGAGYCRPQNIPARR